MLALPSKHSIQKAIPIPGCNQSRPDPAKNAASKKKQVWGPCRTQKNTVKMVILRAEGPILESALFAGCVSRRVGAALMQFSSLGELDSLSIFEAFFLQLTSYTCSFLSWENSFLKHWQLQLQQLIQLEFRVVETVVVENGVFAPGRKQMVLTKNWRNF